MSVVTGTSETVDKLALGSGDDADENVWALVEGCNPFWGVPARLNNLENVSVGCTTAASVLAEVAPLPVSDCFVTAATAIAVGTSADVDRTMLSVLPARTSAVGLLLDASSGVDGVAVGIIEEVAATIEVGAPPAIEGIIDEEDIGTGVELWMSARFEAISVVLRNRAAL